MANETQDQLPDLRQEPTPDNLSLEERLKELASKIESKIDEVHGVSVENGYHRQVVDTSFEIGF
jgi:hypothetical protein